VRLLGVSLLLLLSILLSAGCGGTETVRADPEAARLNTEGLDLIRVGDYSGAIAKLEAAVEKSPDSKTYITNLAFALYHSDRYDEAIARFSRSLEIDPGDYLTYLDYGTCLRLAGRAAEAIPILEKGVGLSAGTVEHPRLLSELARCYESAGNMDMTIETVRRLIDVSPHAEYYSRLGDLLQENGDIEGAESAYRDAVNMSPNYAPAMNNLGLLLCENGNKAEGMKLYHLVIERDPMNPVAHNNLAMEQWEKGYMDNAIEEIKAAIASDPNNPLYHFHYALFLEDKGDKNGANAELQAALQLDPGYTDAVAKLKELKG